MMGPGKCFYCDRAYTSRCAQQILLGSPGMPGAQAEYLRVAMADASLFHMPGGMRKELGLMMCDILPTGYSVAMNARRLADEDQRPGDARGGAGGGARAGAGRGKSGVCVVVGCGPVRAPPSATRREEG